MSQMKRNSFDYGIVHIVFDGNTCIGVYRNLRDAKIHLIKSAFKTIECDHYDPDQRFRRYHDIYSLNAETKVQWEDVWKKQKGTHDGVLIHQGMRCFIVA
jgi:hypothetical protein